MFIAGVIVGGVITGWLGLHSGGFLPGIIVGVLIGAAVGLRGGGSHFSWKMAKLDHRDRKRRLGL